MCTRRMYKLDDVSQIRDFSENHQIGFLRFFKKIEGGGMSARGNVEEVDLALAIDTCFCFCSHDRMKSTWIIRGISFV